MTNAANFAGGDDAVVGPAKDAVVGPAKDAVVGPVNDAVIGVIGVGAMGGPMARRLLACGCRVVVHDVDRARVDALADAGAIAAHSAAEVADHATIVLTVVVDSAQTDEVLFGTTGVAGRARRGLVIVMCSTVAPGYAKLLGPRLARHGIELIDAPISGGPGRALDGTLSMMIGASEPLLNRARQLLETVATRRFHVGPTAGDGSAMKVVNNMLAGINLAAAAEALALAERLGMDLRMVHDVVNASSGGSWMFGDRVPRILAGSYAPPKAAAKILAKDVGLALDVADAARVPVPIARAARDAFAGALALGLGDLDDAVVLDYCRAQIAVVARLD